MPYEWQAERPGEGVRRLLIWRHRSLTPRGFAWVIGGAAGLMVLPLLALVGSAVLWGLLPFALAALAGLWWGVQHGWRGGGTHETVELDTAHIEIVRHDPGRPPRRWRANPYWVRLALRRDGPVEDYLTVTDGGGREIELGAFLTPGERRSLRAELEDALEDARRPGG